MVPDPLKLDSAKVESLQELQRYMNKRVKDVGRNMSDPRRLLRRQAAVRQQSGIIKLITIHNQIVAFVRLYRQQPGKEPDAFLDEKIAHRQGRFCAVWWSYAEEYEATELLKKLLSIKQDQQRATVDVKKIWDA